ncbi:cyclin-dependent kinase inhibitor 3 family protein [Vibrio sp. TRT 21S02]|uniref:cyclin-dependent kinase inhibitor 3 family protein n=1 Tax=Vibrio sp. TRT 21S02 TaxID=3418507 RepID=UPI003CF14C26
MTHPIWQLPLPQGGLVLTPCPGTKGEPLQASLMQLKANGVTSVVTALSDDELMAKDVAQLGEQVKALGMRWYQLEIEDDCAPDSAFAGKWQVVSPALHQALQRDEKIAMHCMGGSGRTGLLAAHLLLEQGWPLAQIIEQVQALRPGAFTKPVQREYIERIALS